eukprot:TRINITY_DN108264_c0_g1_i1.p1 TRINITY_DN108264_c0_g1~~TRINITY_DN108264_c0_g1_i1.p1  ORF type:complete len:212 (+),score=37.02 TRINITY_DN108264_c0_g1_i1:100-735(+)
MAILSALGRMWQKLAVATVSVALLSSGGADARCPVIHDEPAPTQPLMGGPTAAKPIDHEIEEIWTKCQAAGTLIHSRKKRGETIVADKIHPCFYTSQVVAGLNYYVAVSTCDDDACDYYYQVDIYKPLPFMRLGPRIMDITKKALPSLSKTTLQTRELLDASMQTFHGRESDYDDRRLRERSAAAGEGARSDDYAAENEEKRYGVNAELLV